MSNRFPADDEHLHPYHGNLKHHKVEKSKQHRLREALLKLVELEDRTLEGMSSCAPSSEEWLKAFNEARYVIDITRPLLDMSVNDSK